MTPADWLKIVELLFIPLILIVVKKLLNENKDHSDNLLQKVDEFRIENTRGLDNLADKIERTLERHSDKLDNHNGRISTLEGKIDTPNKHRRYDDS